MVLKIFENGIENIFKNFRKYLKINKNATKIFENGIENI